MRAGCPRRSTRRRHGLSGRREINRQKEAATPPLFPPIKIKKPQDQSLHGSRGLTLSAVATDWRERNTRFDARFADELAKIDTEGRGLAALKKSLSDLQISKTTLDDAVTRKQRDLLPDQERALAHRDALLTELVEVRRDRRDRRKKRIKELNGHMSGAVRIKLNAEEDETDFHGQLTGLARGSSLRKEVLQSLSRKSLPIKLVRSFLEDTPDQVAKATEIDEKYIERLFDFVVEKKRLAALLALQTTDLPDTLSVEFRKPGVGYEPIEQLAHGEKCTAILIIAMADGTEPLIIDQPEDALHAPWIEEHLVDRLRDLRGSRQYVFATRNPGLVVSADAEMIITLTSDATRGRVEASGSLERHDMNELVLYHLEGGPAPFKRRTRKLGPSVN